MCGITYITVELMTWVQDTLAQYTKKKKRKTRDRLELLCFVIHTISTISLLEKMQSVSLFYVNLQNLEKYVCQALPSLPTYWSRFCFVNLRTFELYLIGVLNLNFLLQLVFLTAPHSFNFPFKIIRLNSYAKFINF